MNIKNFKSNNFILKLVLWSGSILFVLIVGMVYFPKESPNLGFWGALYYSIRLFILENDLAVFPKNWPLIFVYFYAPMVMISAIGTAITFLFRISPTFGCKWKKDHVVICGAGRTGKLLAASLKRQGLTVVMVDWGDPEEFDEWSSENKIPIVYGDFLSLKTLNKAACQYARTVIFASGDDLANLEGVVGTYGWLSNGNGPIRLLWAHIAEEKLADIARSVLRTSGNISIRIFDTYHIAATRMLDKYFIFDQHQDIKNINILGFGKFGRDLMEALITKAKAYENRRILVVDKLDRQKEVMALAADYSITKRVDFIKADIKDLIVNNKEKSAFFLCTDDDIGNLATALMLSKKIHGHHIYVRMVKWPMPAIQHLLCKDKGITFVNINALLEKGIKDLPGILSPAKPSDLKRVMKKPE